MNQTQVLFVTVYFLCFSILPQIVQPILELNFWGRFSNHKVKAVHYICYILLSFSISTVELRLPPAPLSPWFLMIRIALLFGFGSLLFKCPAAISLPCAVVTKTVTLLSAGITGSITFLFASPIAGTAFGKTAWGGLTLGLMGQLLTYLLIVFAYHIIQHRFRWTGALPNQYLLVFCLPILMVLFMEQYIFNDIYGNKVVMDIENGKFLEPLADHLQVLFIQLFACFTLFSTLYACRRLTEDFSNRTRLMLLERETALQRDYLAESRIRLEQTQSFRHDIKNHLLTLSGLLEQNETQNAKKYLGKLENISTQLSYPCKTGNAVVDIVLGSKLSIAIQNNIPVECTVKIPSPCLADDLDLCILFSNAVDNALHACSKLEMGLRYIHISSRQKGDFFMLEIENSCLPDGTYEDGIGLSNMKTVAEKYHGAVTAEKQGNCFRLNVLLIISRCLNDIPVKPH